MGFAQLADISPTIEEIDRLQSHVDRLKASRPDAYDRIMEVWAVESTYNSNNIEGSTLSLGDTALLYEGAQVNGPENDIRQAEGGFAALGFLQRAVSEKAELTEDIVRRAHELIFAEAKDPSTRGTYRTTEVEITGTAFQPTPAVYVPERMEQLILSCSKSKRHPAVIAALFHLEFESIHPFVNANGRTGRLISNLILMLAGYEPVNIQAESRARYISALRSFQLKDDPFPFVAFFCSNLRDRLEKMAKQLEGEQQPRIAAHRSAFDIFEEEEAAESEPTAQSKKAR